MIIVELPVFLIELIVLVLILQRPGLVALLHEHYLPILPFQCLDLGLEVIFLILQQLLLQL